MHIGLNAVAAAIPEVVPHEIMHQLTGHGDNQIVNHIFSPNRGGPGGTTVLTSRRMTYVMENDARTGPGGARLLRNP